MKKLILLGAISLICSTSFAEKIQYMYQCGNSRNTMSPFQSKEGIDDNAAAIASARTFCGKLPLILVLKRVVTKVPIAGEEYKTTAKFETIYELPKIFEIPSDENANEEEEIIGINRY